MQAKNSRPAVLCFAGLDPSGGAGLQADIESIASCGGHALPIATCLTVQNSIRADAAIAVDAGIIEQQFAALINDIPISACKISIIPNQAIATCLAALLQQLPDTPIIYDPVFAASQGSEFTQGETIDVIKAQILPQVTCMTPNAHEVNILLGKSITNLDAASELCQLGPEYILATGADMNTQQVHNILLSDQGVVERYHYPRLPHQYHGSGCTLSSALSCALAQKIPLPRATREAQDYTYQALQAAQRIGRGQWLPTRISRH